MKGMLGHTATGRDTQHGAGSGAAHSSPSAGAPTHSGSPHKEGMQHGKMEMMTKLDSAKGCPLPTNSPSRMASRQGRG